MPPEIIVPRLSRLTMTDALNEVRAVLAECFWPLDVRYEKVVRTVDYLRFSQGATAGQQFLLLDPQCQFFVRFALETYGLRLVTTTL